MLGPAGALVERGRVAIDSDGKGTADDHGTPDTGGGGRSQQLGRTVNVHTSHLGGKCSTTPDADLVGEVQHVLDAVAGRAHRAGLLEVAGSAFDVERVEYPLTGVSPFEHARAHS